MEAGSASGAHTMQVAPSCQVAVSAPETTTRQQPQEQQQQQQHRQQQQRQEQQQEQQRKRPPGMASAASGALSGIAIGALLQVETQPGSVTQLMALDTERGPGTVVVDCEGQAWGNEGLLLVVGGNGERY